MPCLRYRTLNLVAEREEQRTTSAMPTATQIAEALGESSKAVARA